jgi:autotransporter passenger strand-loop-strand repeat protein
VLVGCTAIDTTVSGGLFELDSGAVASNTTLVSGGLELVDPDAVAGDTTVGAGGEEVLRGGSASVTVLSGGTLTLYGTDSTVASRLRAAARS